ncbi:MAG: hypothetical protein AAGD38_16505, partial [Acidobacteriota bacterium]
LEPELLLLTLVLTVLVCLDATSWRRSLLAGIAAALAIMTRATVLPVFLLVPVAYVLAPRRARTWRHAAAVFVAPILVAVVALQAWGWTASGQLGTPAMNPGTVFFEGNNPVSWGTSAVYPPSVLEASQNDDDLPDAAHVYYRTIARASVGSDLTIKEVNAYWSSRAMHFLRDHPGHALERLRVKMTMALHEYRWHDIASAWIHDPRMKWPPFPFALLSSFALLGTIVCAHRWRELLIFYALLGAQLGVMLVFYVSARQRIVLLPILILFAAYGLRAIAHVRGARRMIAIAAVALVALALLVPSEIMRDESEKRRAFVEIFDRFINLADDDPRSSDDLTWAAARNFATSSTWPPGIDQSEQRFLDARVAAVEARGDSPSVTFDLALAELEAGRHEQAAARLEAVIESEAQFYRGGRRASVPALYLARIHAFGGDRATAVTLLEDALDHHPGDPFVLAELVALTDDTTHVDSLMRYWSAIDAQWLIGRALLIHRRYREAASAYAFVTRRVPDMREVWFEQAAVLGALGATDAGVDSYRRAMALHQQRIGWEEEILGLFEDWLAQHPDRAEVVYNTALVFRAYGHHRRADALLERAASLSSSPDLAARIEADRRTPKR